MMETFPLQWEHVRWQSRRCAVSDFRVVTLRRGRVTGELALHDIARVDVTRSRLERLAGAGTIVISSTREGEPPLRLRAFRADRLALRLSLLVGDVRGVPLDEAVTALPLPSVWRMPPVRLYTVLLGPSILL